MNWFGKSLNHKFTAATFAGLLVSSLAFLGLFLTFYQAELERELGQAARDVNRLLQSSLENAMLKRDLEGLTISRTIVEEYDGSLAVESELGKGSCFVVRIPEASIGRLKS